MRLSYLFGSALSLLSVVSCSTVPHSADALRKEGLTKEDRKSWQEELGWPKSCEEGQSFDTAHIEFYPLEPKLFLVEVACSIGAYQGVYRYFLYDERVAPARHASLGFEVPNAEAVDEGHFVSEKSDELVGSPQFDAKSKELRLWVKSRGIGDCGSYSRYQWSDEKMTLREVRAKPKCDGLGSDPRHWKLIH